MRLLALYNPAGAEHALEALPDFRELSAGQQLGLDSAVTRL